MDFLLVSPIHSLFGLQARVLDLKPDPFTPKFIYFPMSDVISVTTDSYYWLIFHIDGNMFYTSVLHNLLQNIGRNWQPNFLCSGANVQGAALVKNSGITIPKLELLIKSRNSLHGSRTALSLMQARNAPKSFLDCRPVHAST